MHANCTLAVSRYDDYLLDDAASLHGDYDDVRTEHGWEVDSFFRPPRVPEKGHVWLDPHILANPAIADIDGDGQEELVLAVSYFFDRDQYSRPVCTMCISATMFAAHARMLQSLLVIMVFGDGCTALHFNWVHLVSVSMLQ